MLDEITLLIKALGEPEYLYLVLEPALIYGTAVGLVVFGVAYFISDVKAQMLGLAILIVSAAMVFPYLEFRGKAESRISKVYKIESPSTVKAFKAHTEAVKDARWTYITLAGLAAVVLLMGPRSNRFSRWLSLFTAFAAVGVVMVSLNFHFKESQLSHPNLLGIQPKVAATDPEL